MNNNEYNSYNIVMEKNKMNNLNFTEDVNLLFKLCLKENNNYTNSVYGYAQGSSFFFDKDMIMANAETIIILSRELNEAIHKSNAMSKVKTSSLKNTIGEVMALASALRTITIENEQTEQIKLAR